MKITNSVRKSIENAINYYGNVYQLSKEMGISHSTIMFWMSGKTANINGELWNTKIRDFLKNFEPSEEFHEPALRQYVAAPAPMSVNPNEAMILTFDQIKNWDFAYTPVEELLSKSGKRIARFSRPVGKHMFALEIDSDHAGFLPAGALLLVASSDYAKSGDVVIAKLIDEDMPVIAAYRDIDNQMELAIYEGKSIRIHRSSNNKREVLQWILPVMEANVIFRHE